MPYKLVRTISIGLILLWCMLFTTRYATAGYLWCENEKGENDWGHYPLKPDQQSPLVKNYKDFIISYATAMKDESNPYVWIPTTFNVLACYGREGPNAEVYQPSNGALLVTHHNSFGYYSHTRFLCADVDKATFCKTLLDLCNKDSNKYTKVRSKEYTANSDAYRIELSGKGMCE